MIKWVESGQLRRAKKEAITFRSWAVCHLPLPISHWKALIRSYYLFLPYDIDEERRGLNTKEVGKTSRKFTRHEAKWHMVEGPGVAVQCSAVQCIAAESQSGHHQFTNYHRSGGLFRSAAHRRNLADLGSWRHKGDQANGN